MTRSPFTPGVGGYLLAVLISFGVCILPGLVLGPYVVFVAAGVLVLGTPIGLVGSMLTHLLCRNLPQQGVHVFVTGLWGFLLTVLLLSLDGSGTSTPVLVLGVWVATCAAIGRGAVIGLVPAAWGVVSLGYPIDAGGVPVPTDPPIGT